jgi:hypothetical protein
MTSAFPAAREWGQSDDPLESRSTPQEEIARGGSAGQAKEIDDMRRLRRRARGEEMTNNAADVIIAYFDSHGINDARAGAFNILDRLKQAGFIVRLAAQADAPTIDNIPSCGQENDYRRALPQSPLTREDIAKAIHARRYHMNAKDTASMFAWYAENPAGTDRSRMAIHSALQDADAVLALTRPDRTGEA